MIVTCFEPILVQRLILKKSQKTVDAAKLMELSRRYGIGRINSAPRIRAFDRRMQDGRNHTPAWCRSLPPGNTTNRTSDPVAPYKGNRPWHICLNLPT
jgi:hypothetical protein